MEASLDTLLSRLEEFPDFEVRPGQIEMAHAVADAIDQGYHLLVEAGTGTGKTFAYLLPALSRGVRTIVSTSTKALQEQLYYKDLPELERLLGRPIHYAILKGRANYVCLLQVEQIRQQTEKDLFETRQQAEQFGRLLSWLEENQTGDLEQFPEPLEDLVRQAVTMDSDGCAGRDCPLFQKCFLMQARAEAEQAEIVVVNHSLLLHDLIIRAASNGSLSLLSAAQLVVIDEAHRLEEAALGALGLSLSAYRLGLLQKKAARLPGQRRTTRKLVEQLGQQAIAFDQELQSRVGEQMQARATGDLVEVLMELERLLGNLQEALRSDLSEATQLAGAVLKAEMTLRYEMVQRPLRRLAEDVLQIRLAIEENDPNRITYIERRARSCALMSYPLDVGEMLREILFKAFPSVVCTSATLAIPVRGEDDGFGYTRRRLGADEAHSLQVPSPFNYREQALIYLPEDPELLDPSQGDRPENRQRYEEALIREILRLIAASRGRALVLTTSYYMMQRLANALQDCGYPVFRQGQAPRSELIEQLRRAPSVLVATRSYWEGIDVRGDAVSLVVIDRLPFPGREDIFWQARYERAGTRWFDQEALPQALLTLKQGFGRLIRSVSDRGVVALLDGRLLTRTYGRFLLQALPNCPRTQRIQEVEDFFKAQRPGLHAPLNGVYTRKSRQTAASHLSDLDLLWDWL